MHLQHSSQWVKCSGGFLEIADPFEKAVLLDFEGVEQASESLDERQLAELKRHRAPQLI